MAKKSSKREKKKNSVEKERLLVTSNLSFSHGVFKRLLLQAPKQTLFWERDKQIMIKMLAVDSFCSFSFNKQRRSGKESR